MTQEQTLDQYIAEGFTPCQGWKDANKDGMDKAREIAAWLTARGYQETRPIALTIRRGRKVETFFGAMYKDGNDANGAQCLPRIHVVGKVPAHMIDTKISKKDRHIYTFFGAEFYLACYADPFRPIKTEFESANPHGHTFTLCSTMPGVVDQYEPRRKRVPLDVLFF